MLCKCMELLKITQYYSSIQSLFLTGDNKAKVQNHRGNKQIPPNVESILARQWTGIVRHKRNGFLRLVLDPLNQLSNYISNRIIRNNIVGCEERGWNEFEKLWCLNKLTHRFAELIAHALTWNPVCSALHDVDWIGQCWFGQKCNVSFDQEEYVQKSSNF